MDDDLVMEFGDESLQHVRKLMNKLSMALLHLSFLPSTLKILKSLCHRQ